MGNVLSSTIESAKTSAGKIVSSSTYANNGNLLGSVTQRGNTTRYGYSGAFHKMTASEANGNYSTLSQDESNPMLNRATSQLYPPGSTFKTVVAAAALETGEYQTDTEIPAGSSYTLPGTVTQLTNAVSQADGSDGKITLEDAMAYSSNTAFAQLGVALGDDTAL